MTELARRILFSIIAAPIAIALVYIGDAALATLLAALAGVAAWEFCRIARSAGLEPLETIGVAGAATIPLLVHAAHLRVFAVPLTLIPVGVLTLLTVAIWARGPDRHPLGAVAATILGVVYTGATLSYGYAIRYHDYAVGQLAGTALVAFPLVLTWMSDIGAFAVGRTLGGRKLIPAISPGKTVAGAVGAVVTTVLVAFAYVALVLGPAAQLSLAPWAVVVFGLAISVAAQLGDLAESLLKREAGVKDSSRLIPGHGGLLDRLDSLFFVLPLAYLLLDWLLLPAPRL